jgi:hypothetical protein
VPLCYADREILGGVREQDRARNVRSSERRLYGDQFIGSDVRVWPPGACRTGGDLE